MSARAHADPITLNNRHGAAMACVAVSISCCCSVALGADERPKELRTLEEVIVTAQKRSERLQDVPVPVTAIDAQGLATTSQLRLQDYYNQIPGLAVALAGNGNEPVVTIRGISTGGSALGANPTVAVAIDEVAYGASVATGANFPAVPDIDPSDLQRIEVLRGPQGTLYGSSSIGGLLKFVTVDPSTDAVSGRVQVGSASVSDGDDLGYSVRGSLNIPLGDTFAVRGSAFTVRDPGYVDNAETGRRDANRRDSEGGRLSALWRPSDAFSLKLSALYQDSERLGAAEVDTALGSDPKQAYLRDTGIYDRRSQAYSATAVGKLGQVELTSASGYSIDKLRDDVDLTTFGTFLRGRAIALFGVDRVVTQTDREVKKFTQELRASIPIGSRVTWLLGGFYTKEETDAVADTLAADDNNVKAGTLVHFHYQDGKFEETAAFTNITIGLTDRWDVQFGGRFSDHEQSYRVVRSGAIFGPNPIIGPPLDGSDEAFTYLVTPRFKISPDMMVYARMASGFRPGGPNSLCGSPGVPCGFKPDETENYDLGIKGSVAGGALSFDASVYYIDWKDLQLIGVRSPLGPFSYTANASRAESQGVELSLETRLATGLTASVWGAYNEAEVTEPFPPGQLVGLPGYRLPFSPRVSGSLSLSQEFPLWSTATGYAEGGVTYVGDRVGEFLATSVRQEYPSYTQVDLRAGFNYESWTLDIYANNVTDKRGVLRTGLDSVFAPTYVVYTQPRTMGLSLTKSF